MSLMRTTKDRFGLAQRGPIVALLLASTITGLHFLSLTFSRPLFPLLASSMGASDALIGLLTALAYLLPLVVALPAGMLIDRLGVKALAIFGSVCLVLGNAAYVLAQGFALLACARIFNGLAQVIVLVAVQSYVAELGRGSQQDRNFATIFFFTGVGQLTGPLVAGLLAREISMRFAFGVATVVALLPLALAVVIPDVSEVLAGAAGRVGATRAVSPGVAEPAHRPSQPRGLDLAGIGRLLRLPGVRIGIGASLIMLLADGARESYYPLYAQSIGLDEVAVGALLSLHALFSIMMQPFAGALASRWGRTRVLALAMFLGVIGLGAVPLVRGFVPMAVIVAFAGLSFGTNQPPSMACVADAAPKEMRGMAMALRLTGNRVGLLLSPVLASGVVSAWGLPAYFYAGAGVLLGGCFLMLRVARDGDPAARTTAV